MKTSDREDASTITEGVVWSFEAKKTYTGEEIDAASVDPLTGVVKLLTGGRGYVVATYQNEPYKYQLKVEQAIEGGKIIEKNGKKESGTLTVSQGVTFILEFVPDPVTATGDISWDIDPNDDTIVSLADYSESVSIFKSNDNKYLASVTVNNAPSENQEYTVTAKADDKEVASYKFTVSSEGVDRETLCQLADICLATDQEVLIDESADSQLIPGGSRELEWEVANPDIASITTETGTSEETGESNVFMITVKGLSEGYTMIKGNDKSADTDTDEPDSEPADEPDTEGEDEGDGTDNEDGEEDDSPDATLSVMVLDIDEEDVVEEFKEANLRWTTGYKINGSSTVRNYKIGLGEKLDLKLTHNDVDSTASWESKYPSIASVDPTSNSATTTVKGLMKGCTIISANSALFANSSTSRAQIIVRVGVDKCVESGPEIIGDGERRPVIALNDSWKVFVRENQALVSGVTFSGGEDIISFNGSTATGKKLGKATINAIKDNDTITSTEFKVANPTSIVFHGPKYGWAEAGKTTRICRVVKGTNANNISVMWSGANEYYSIVDGGTYAADVGYDGAAYKKKKNGKTKKTFGLKNCVTIKGTGKATSSKTTITAEAKPGLSKSYSFNMKSTGLVVDCPRSKIAKKNYMWCTIEVSPTGKSLCKNMKKKKCKKRAFTSSSKYATVKKIKKGSVKGQYKVKVYAKKKTSKVTLTIKTNDKKATGKTTFQVTN